MIRARESFAQSITAVVLDTLTGGRINGISTNGTRSIIPDSAPYPVLSAQDSMEFLRTLAHSPIGGGPHENTET